MAVVDLEGEEQRVVSWAPKYKVSNMGRVLGSRGWVLQPLDRGNGYLSVNLFPTKDKSVMESIHVLVLTEFVSLRPDGNHGCHNDGDKNNNKLSNLRWDTVKANIGDQLKHGTFVRGEKNGNSILTEDLVREIRREHDPKAGRSSRILGRRYGVSADAIKLVVAKKSWRHVA
ncbi:HNH endonuclease [Rhizobium ruizarguesonis]|uniref:Uncharacterized protein n=2 Tax=Rhizobium TaxID=379 RepID=A0A179BVE8_RHILE|nr:HNH endonuclease [Rhizobium leguminosarum]OAP95074.1 hypothetical protein A4U53_17785 [Rhizobium leguminosarum]